MRSALLIVSAFLLTALPSRPADAPAGMVLVPAGAFQMGCSQADTRCQADERPAHRVLLDAFFIDRTEVTAAAYGRCVSAGRCTPPEIAEGCNWGKRGRQDHPVNCVSWQQADAYCRFAGGRLPTEAEWEKACRGTDDRIYPWGPEPADCERAVMVSTESGCGAQRTFPVCSHPAGNSPYGLCDMAGNVWEWVADWYAPTVYAQGPERIAPVGPPGGARKVLRGGSYFGIARYLRASNRDADPPGSQDNAIGFRCARDAKP
ncbi:MAG: formylglycine-generating enzyme family protein [Deltaproteobacteria bacterium]|nr:formylglycine-generating enzyme family protein [Deltaproteobacteria bacterium]